MGWKGKGCIRNKITIGHIRSWKGRKMGIGESWLLKDGGLVVVARLLVVLVIVGFVVSWDDLVGMLFDVVQVLG